MGRGPMVRVRRLRGDDPHAERREALAAVTPYLSLVRAPMYPAARTPSAKELVVATYNVHRWTGTAGTSRTPDPERASFVISELGADVLALQEVIRPFAGEDPLVRLADQLRLHVAFVATRIHRQGELGNAILSRWPIASASLLDLNFSRIERRTAVAAQLSSDAGPLSLIATHLALVDRTRHRQVRHLLDHPQLQGPVILLGDMNMWRTNDKANRALEAELPTHSEIDWPASFPAARPVLALDRIYARGAKVLEVRSHQSPAAKRASDHLPVIARVALL
ncbi:MAG: endonuclease/exonuclease/phosphatase family protein [Myxococcota bacterium]|nr:endonuclease/exonuclease/phosphatase family protein [Myxococcota bacterium]